MNFNRRLAPLVDRLALAADVFVTPFSFCHCRHLAASLATASILHSWAVCGLSLRSDPNARGGATTSRGGIFFLFLICKVGEVFPTRRVPLTAFHTCLLHLLAPHLPAPTRACSYTCLPDTCMLPCLPTCTPACFYTCLLSYLPVSALACSHTCLLLQTHTCLTPHLPVPDVRRSFDYLKGVMITKVFKNFA